MINRYILLLTVWAAMAFMGLSHSAHATEPVTRSASGIQLIQGFTLAPKQTPICMANNNAVFAQEIAANKNIYPYNYTVSHIGTGNSYAVVKMTQQYITTYQDYTTGTSGSLTSKTATFNNLQEAFDFSNEFFVKYPIAEQADLLIWTPATAFANALKPKLKQWFTTHNSCVEYKGPYTPLIPTLSPANTYIDSNMGYTFMESLYPRDPAQPVVVSTVAVIDTARSIDVYPELAGRIADIAPNFVSIEYNDPVFDTVEPNQLPMKATPYHFDMIAGIILSETPSNIDVIQIHTIADQKMGPSPSIVGQAIDWAVANSTANNTRVINMSLVAEAQGNILLSLGSRGEIPDAIARAEAKGIVVVQGVGNSGKYVDSTERLPRGPADYEIAVGTIDAAGHVISAFGPGMIDVVVPNVGALTVASHTPSGAFTTLDRTFIGGATSIATAEISGFVALMLDRQPWMTPAQVRESICNSADTLHITTDGNALQNALQSKARSSVKCGILNTAASMAYAKAHFGPVWQFLTGGSDWFSGVPYVSPWAEILSAGCVKLGGHVIKVVSSVCSTLDHWKDENYTIYVYVYKNTTSFGPPYMYAGFNYSTGLDIPAVY